MFDAVKKHAEGGGHFHRRRRGRRLPRRSKPSTQKIKKTDRRHARCSLVPNPDILAWVAAQPKPPFCVGFAAESQKLDEFADAKRRRKKVPLMVANLAQHAIGADDNEVTLLDDAGTAQAAARAEDRGGTADRRPHRRRSAHRAENPKIAACVNARLHPCGFSSLFSIAD